MCVPCTCGGENPGAYGDPQMTENTSRAGRLRSRFAVGIALLIISPVDDFVIAAVVGWWLPIPALAVVMTLTGASLGWLALMFLRRR